jgi:hypothetical protein
MVGIINTSFTITINHNQFTTAHNKSSAEPFTAEDSLHSRSRSMTDCSYNCQLTWNSALYSLGADLTENTCHVTRIHVYWPVTWQWHGADHIENTSSVVRMGVYWPVAQHWAWRGPHRKQFFQHLFIVACAYFGRCLEMGLHVTKCCRIDERTLPGNLQNPLPKCSVSHYLSTFFLFSLPLAREPAFDD